MSTLANILHDLGNEVTGYDDSRHYKFTEEGLNKRNIKIFYEPHEIDEDTIVTYSKAFSIDHPEIKRVKELGLKIMDYNQVVGEVTKMFETVGVCGTHGKTTTSLLISHIIKNVIGCSYFVGDGTGHANKNDKIFVIESDEYNKHFLAYYPHIAVITRGVGSSPIKPPKNAYEPFLTYTIRSLQRRSPIALAAENKISVATMGCILK